jgi:hypothetical protein
MSKAVYRKIYKYYKEIMILSRWDRGTIRVYYKKDTMIKSKKFKN